MRLLCIFLAVISFSVLAAPNKGPSPPQEVIQSGHQAYIIYRGHNATRDLGAVGEVMFDGPAELLAISFNLSHNNGLENCFLSLRLNDLDKPAATYSTSYLFVHISDSSENIHYNFPRPVSLTMPLTLAVSAMGAADGGNCSYGVYLHLVQSEL